MPPLSNAQHAYHREAAAAHMVANVPRVHVETSVEEAFEALRGRFYDCADTVFVIDAAGQLVGIVRINEMFGRPSDRIGDIMQEEHEAVRPGDDQEAIAQLAIRLNMIAVPVVDDLGQLIGAVPPEAVFRILREEHMEDLQRFAGIAPHEHGADAALDASLFNRFSRRLPWLVFGLFASSLVTLIMVGFEHALSRNVAAAFFVPALVYIAGAIGTQAVSVSVRSLSGGGFAIGPLLRDELIIGLAIGTTLGLLAGGAVFFSFGQLPLALAVGLSVLGGGAVSALAGFALPWGFQRFGFDPALGSGPICTIVQDAASLSLYFVLITILMP
ncbi:magnesium transporter [Limimaricola soesokkakensis]|uniref:Magnesium transporter n=1 Tax=Limimaricola soesokkakensis TaxID=1343159 RepID=A0A1X7A4Y8_9RHOB|nr:magnesium transporter [Limimaricola soesokkakensis]PSK80675.1 magnesium transporter [Limimaricola soesokkakensis]SLN70747.1 Magnesium transporter MgtE [Limimaricola soesokkakensis]